MHCRVAGSLCLVSLTFAGCIIPKDAKANVVTSAQLGNKWVVRGQTFIDEPTLLPRLALSAPTVNGDTIRLVGEGAMPLGNDTGKGWYPDGHAGRFAQVDLVGSYAKTFGDITLEGGVHNYVLPNGKEFVNTERGTTSELFLLASANVLEATPYVSVHYDIDEVQDWYFRGGITESIPLGETFFISLDGSLGYITNGQAQWLFGADKSGLADLRGMIALNWRYDERTTFNIGLNGSTMLDSGIARWMQQQNQYTIGTSASGTTFGTGIDPDPVWVTVGGAFAF